MSESTIKYEKLVPTSFIETFRVAVDVEGQNLAIEFGFMKDDKTMVIDVSKALTTKMTIDLIEVLNQTLKELSGEVSEDD